MWFKKLLPELSGFEREETLGDIAVYHHYYGSCDFCDGGPHIEILHK